MNAKKCDICGALYMRYNDTMANCNKPNGFRLLREDAGFNLHPLGRYDCCPDCMSKIQTLMESLKVHTDDVDESATYAISEHDVDNGCSSLAKAGITLGKD